MFRSKQVRRMIGLIIAVLNLRPRYCPRKPRIPRTLWSPSFSSTIPRNSQLIIVSIVSANRFPSKMTFTLPNIFRRHSVVKGLLASKLISPKQKIIFNGNSRAFVDLSDPEPRNVFLKSAFEPDFLNSQRHYLIMKELSLTSVPMSDFTPLVWFQPINERSSIYSKQTRTSFLFLNNQLNCTPTSAFTSITAVSATHTEKQTFNWKPISRDNPMSLRFRAKELKFPTLFWMIIATNIR